MPIRFVKMNMSIGSKNAGASRTSAPINKSMSQLYAPMVARISDAKSGCACGK